jgi:acid phosphatase type 7
VLTTSLLVLTAFNPGLKGVVAGPYLQLGSAPGNVLVQLIQTGKEPLSVEVTGKSVRSMPDIRLAMPGHTLRRFVVEGVAPGSTFNYKVKSGSTSFSGRGTGSRTSGQACRIAVMGDSGRGLPGQRLVAKQLDVYKPNLLVHVGDIVYSHGRESEYLKFHFPVYGNLLSQSPSVAAPGNHDTAYRDLRAYPDGLAYYKLWHTPIKKEPWAKDRGNFSLTYGDAQWVIIDSNTYNNWGSKLAQTWLRRELSKGSRMKWRFVAFHHPPFHSSDKKKDEVYMQSIAPLLEEMKVSIVFCGHVHNYQRAKPTPNGPTYIVTGAGGAELYDQKLAKDRTKWKPFTQQYIPGYSFTALEYDAKKLVLKQINTSGKVIDTFSIGR